MNRGLAVGFGIMALILLAIAVLTPWSTLNNGHIGIIMLCLIVVAMMMGFPSAFTLMGMGVIFSWFAYRSVDPTVAVQQTLDLAVQRSYGVMTSDVLIAVPLFLFMGYLVERANLIKKLFHAIHIAMARIPGSLAVATLVTCAIFATATGIVGAVVTLMGLLALPAMLRAGYDTKLSAGVIAAGGTLGILIPPSIMLIVYGATAGVSVVQLYAGAFFPGLLLAGLYVIYVIIVAWFNPHWAPPLSQDARSVPLPTHMAALSARHGKLALPALLRAVAGRRDAAVSRAAVGKVLLVASLPALAFALIMGLTWNTLTQPTEEFDTSGLVEMGVSAEALRSDVGEDTAPGISEPPVEDDLAPGIGEPPALEEPAALEEPPALTEPEALQLPPALEEAPADEAPALAEPDEAAPATADREPAPAAFWKTVGVGVAALAVGYLLLTFPRLEVFRMLLTSFFPLAVMILGVLGSIVFGLATPTEAAAMGALGGFVLAAFYMANEKPREARRRWWPSWIVLWGIFLASVIWFILHRAHVIAAPLPPLLGQASMLAFLVWAALASWQVKLIPMLRESVYLTAKTSAMVCWLFVGASIYSAAFSLLGGQHVVEQWVLSLDMTPLEFLLLTQFIIFILGWPLEWTEIIVIFMPIFIPLLAHFNIDPLFFGLLVALNLQMSFLSPPMAPSAFYLKGVAPPSVSLGQIFLGSMPFLGLVIVSMAILYIWPQIGLWLPGVLYK
ncbi:MAG: TRAP transporter large permease subunit [Thiobacillus sp.]|uniref:TRAP transporter large permease subunit n=1 Tax=Thiobacillus sp. TaxID=924 RepID=UPI0027351DC5|nr:TRAP transporter large permease subunit [Thiobacillus sp.]MDP3585049.1 TRAP transporter large permease subunit [Thiobacillus sp.]